MDSDDMEKSEENGDDVVIEQYQNYEETMKESERSKTPPTALVDPNKIFAANKLFKYEFGGCVGFYLSNNHVVKPYHGLTEGEDNILGDKLIAADLAIVKVVKDKEIPGDKTPLTMRIQKTPLDNLIDGKVRVTCNVHGGGNEIVSIQPMLVDGIIPTSCLVYVAMTENLLPGNSGTLIEGALRVINNSSERRGPFEENNVFPYFMIIARYKDNLKRGIAVDLTELFYIARQEKSDIGSELDDCQLILDNLDSKIEYISKTFYTKVLKESEQIWKDYFGVADKKQADLKKTVTEKLNINDKTESIEYKFVTDVFEKFFMEDSDTITKLVQTSDRGAYIKFHYVWLFGGLLGAAKVNEEDPYGCWVNKKERDSDDPNSPFLFNFAMNLMTELSAVYKNNCKENVNDVVLFSNSIYPITIDKKHYDLFQKSGDGKPMHVCHHPFICENNKANKGTKMTHCCFRPSHLIHMNKDFNTFCTSIQSLPFQTSTEFKISWEKVNDTSQKVESKSVSI